MRESSDWKTMNQSYSEDMLLALPTLAISPLRTVPSMVVPI